MKNENEIKEMSEVFQYKNKEYLVVFNLNVLKCIQDKYGSFDKWQGLIFPTDKKKECNIEALLFGFTEAVNEGIDIQNEEKNENNPFITEKYVGRMFTELGLQAMQEKLLKAVKKSVDNKNDKSKN